MIGVLRTWLTNTRTRRTGVVLAGVTALGLGVWAGRGWLVHPATAQQAATPVASEQAPSVPASDYTSRVVAYVHKSTPITRQELGEYLIARYGAEKLPLLINRRIVDEACQQRNIVVTAAEVEAALAEDLKGLAVDQATFIKTILNRYKKNLYEWKEDHVRPRVQMTRLAQARLVVSEDELRKAFESAHGEKVDCRIILWSHSKEKEALDQFSKLRDSEAAFAEAAKQQETSWLAAAGGRIKPIGRHSNNEALEREAFKLQPGQVSTLIKTPEGICLVKCDKRLPADTTVNFDAVRAKLESELRATKLNTEMGAVFTALKEKARPQPLLKKTDRVPPGPTPAPSQVVAYIFGTRPVTREELGEFLIARYGAEKLEFLVNRRVIDLACADRKVVVTDAEVEKAFEDDLAMLKCDRKHFEEKILSQWGKNLVEYREDVLRPRLMLTRMAEGRVKVNEEELKKGFEAYHGERLECRVILYPPDQAKYAMTEYARLRDNEAEFAAKAKSQPSPTLAAHGGKIPVFGRHALGDENLEREAFRLQPGEVSPLIGTPQGQVIIKCDRRLPPDKDASLDRIREQLTREIREKKIQQEMQVVFKELRDAANPQLILKNPGKPEDLLAETAKLLSDLPGQPPSASASK
ncbi:MAG: peptidyl-prolyl cis-trans isomerase [Gemmataceae bacterium]